MIGLEIRTREHRSGDIDNISLYGIALCVPSVQKSI